MIQRQKLGNHFYTTKNLKGMGQMWMVMVLKKTITVEVLGQEITNPAELAEGMIGYVPVFETQEAAIEYASDGQIIMEIGLAENADG